jgi:hypothetical protein
MPAGAFKTEVGGWVITFDTQESLTADTNVSTSKSGATINAVYLSSDSDPVSGAVTIFDYPDPMNANSQTYDSTLNSYLKSWKVENATLTDITVDGTYGRRADGYSSVFRRNWHGVVYGKNPKWDDRTRKNVTKNLVYFSSILDEPEFYEMADTFHASKPEGGYRIELGEWFITFTSSEEIGKFVTNVNTGANKDIDTVLLYDNKSHEIGFISIFYFPQLLTMDDSRFDGNLNVLIDQFKVTSPVKKKIVIDGTSGRRADGYSSVFYRDWHGAVYAYDPQWDDFTGTNTSHNMVMFHTILSESMFKEMIDSIHVTRKY